MSLKKLKATLKQEQHRVTQSRVLTYQILEESFYPLSAKEIFEKGSKLGLENLDLVSVYRNLSLFSKLGLAHKMMDGRYSSCEQQQSCSDHPHIHVISMCQNCSKAFEADAHNAAVCDAIEQIKKSSKLKAVSQITVQGLCSSCSR